MLCPDLPWPWLLPLLLLLQVRGQACAQLTALPRCASRRSPWTGLLLRTCGPGGRGTVDATPLPQCAGSGNVQTLHPQSQLQDPHTATGDARLCWALTPPHHSSHFGPPPCVHTLVPGPEGTDSCGARGEPGDRGGLGAGRVLFCSLRLVRKACGGCGNEPHIHVQDAPQDRL